MLINKQINIAIVILTSIIILFGITNIDYSFQDYMYDFTNHQWLLNRDLQPYKFIFYDGIKKILISIIIIFIISLIFFRKTKLIKEYKQGIMIVVFSAILIPLVIGSLKRSTNMPCPKNEIHYDGKMIKTAVWKRYAEPYKNMKHINCWPAGHASGGFAFLSLFFLFKSKRNKYISLIGALTIGFSMGIYKMLIGDHFLSHTLITMLIAWLIILLIKKIVTKYYS